MDVIKKILSHCSAERVRFFKLYAFTVTAALAVIKITSMLYGIDFWLLMRCINILLIFVWLLGMILRSGASR